MTNISPRHREDDQFYRGMRQFKRVADDEAAARPAMERFIAEAKRMATKIAEGNRTSDALACAGMFGIACWVLVLILRAISSGVPL